MRVMPVVLTTKCSHVMKLLTTESEICLGLCLRSLQLYGDQAYWFNPDLISGKKALRSYLMPTYEYEELHALLIERVSTTKDHGQN